MNVYGRCRRRLRAGENGGKIKWGLQERGAGSKMKGGEGGGGRKDGGGCVVGIKEAAQAPHIGGGLLKRGRSQSTSTKEEEENEHNSKKVCRGRGEDKRESSSSEEGEWEGGWLANEIEGLEERGGGLATEWEEAVLYWGGGGEALRRKRWREWDEGGWEQWELEEEEPKENGSAVSTGGEVRLEMEGNGGHEGEIDVRGVGEREMNVEGDGEIGGEPLAVGEAPKGRKPLRGRRRGGKRSTTKEEKERLALSMARWLGIKPHRTQTGATTTTARGKKDSTR